MASDYYIDTAGSNASAGTSSTLAWRDFTNINSKILQPGDRLYLKRGSVWHQTLIINGKGQANNFIEIKPYGNGPRPKICGNFPYAPG